MDEACSLKYFATRKVALLLFTKQIRWRPLPDVARSLKDELADLRLSPKIRRSLHEAIGLLLQETQRWAEKHAEMFLDNPQKKGRVHRSVHIRTFHPWIQWREGRYEIDDLETAKCIMEKECEKWPQMRWQFAACYAMKNHLFDDWLYDRHRKSAFKRILSDHPIYNLWLTLYDCKWDDFFETEGRLANQILTQAFCFSITNGFYEMVKFLWDKIGETHREYVGLLQWKAFCFRCRNRETMKFLCTKLCEVNSTSVARITWHTFFDAFHKLINAEVDEKKIDERNRRKVEFLVQNCCDTLRGRLLGMENFRVISDAFRYNHGETFALFLEYLKPEQLRAAREVLDRIHDRKQTTHGERLQRMVVRRQMTFN